MTDAIQVISLTRTPGRREEFAKLNTHLKFEFVDAVDGSKLTPEAIQSTNSFATGLPYTPGAYGCALSHLRLWEKAIELDRPLTIAEDDAIFRLDFEEQHARALQDLGSNWDFVLWGWNFDSIVALNIMRGISTGIFIFDQSQLRQAIPAFQHSIERPHLLRLDKCFGIPAYTISPGGAKKFKSQCFPLTPFRLFFPVLEHERPNNGIDIAMNRIYETTQSHVCIPPLVVSKNEQSISTIQQPS
jgi:glycosyl transferase, family 25